MVLQKIGKGAYKWVEDKKMRDYGDIDYEKKIIRINTNKRINKKPGEIINTLFEEDSHRIHPKMYEKNIKKMAKKKQKTKSKKEKNKLYSKIYA